MFRNISLNKNFQAKNGPVKQKREMSDKAKKSAGIPQGELCPKDPK